VTYKARALKTADALLREDRSLEPLLSAALREAVALGVTEPQTLPLPCTAETAHAVHLTELLLVAGCAAGQRTALAAFDSRYVIPAARRVSGRYTRLEAAELAQAMRERLLVGEGLKRLIAWKGQGPLSAWLRSVATRLALNALPRERALSLDDEEWKDAVEHFTSASNPELALLEKNRQTELRAALTEALRRLPRREKTVLRLHVFQSLSADQLARIFHVNAATVRRWIQGARATVLENVRAMLTHTTRWSPSQLDSALAGISRLDLGLSALGPSSAPRSSSVISST
jgi:RNA polymerase sigma-70 factor (ECF subfamily)